MARGQFTPEWRANLSRAMRNSAKAAAAHARRRGVAVGPASLETRARMSASKRANRTTEPERWQLYYDHYLARLRLEQMTHAALADLPS